MLSYSLPTYTINNGTEPKEHWSLYSRLKIQAATSHSSILWHRQTRNKIAHPKIDKNKDSPEVPLSSSLQRIVLAKNHDYLSAAAGSGEASPGSVRSAPVTLRSSSTPRPPLQPLRLTTSEHYRPPSFPVSTERTAPFKIVRRLDSTRSDRWTGPGYASKRRRRRVAKLGNDGPRVRRTRENPRTGLLASTHVPTDGSRRTAATFRFARFLFFSFFVPSSPGTSPSSESRGAGARTCRPRPRNSDQHLLFFALHPFSLPVPLLFFSSAFRVRGPLCYRRPLLALLPLVCCGCFL